MISRRLSRFAPIPGLALALLIMLPMEASNAQSGVGAGGLKFSEELGRIELWPGEERDVDTVWYRQLYGPEGLLSRPYSQPFHGPVLRWLKRDQFGVAASGYRAKYLGDIRRISCPISGSSDAQKKFHQKFAEWTIGAEVFGRSVKDRLSPRTSFEAEVIRPECVGILVLFQLAFENEWILEPKIEIIRGDTGLAETKVDPICPGGPINAGPDRSDSQTDLILPHTWKQSFEDPDNLDPALRNATLGESSLAVYKLEDWRGPGLDSYIVRSDGHCERDGVRCEADSIWSYRAPDWCKWSEYYNPLSAIKEYRSDQGPFVLLARLPVQLPGGLKPYPPYEHLPGSLDETIRSLLAESDIYVFSLKSTVIVEDPEAPITENENSKVQLTTLHVYRLERGSPLFILHCHFEFEKKIGEAQDGAN